MCPLEARYPASSLPALLGLILFLLLTSQSTLLDRLFLVVVLPPTPYLAVPLSLVHRLISNLKMYLDLLLQSAKIFVIFAFCRRYHDRDILCLVCDCFTSHQHRMLV